MIFSDTAEAASRAASKAMYGGGYMAAGSWAACEFNLTGDDWTVLFGGIGCVIGVAGFLLNWYFKLAHLKIARARALADPQA